MIMVCSLPGQVKERVQRTQGQRQQGGRLDVGGGGGWDRGE